MEHVMVIILFLKACKHLETINFWDEIWDLGVFLFEIKFWKMWGIL